MSGWTPSGGDQDVSEPDPLLALRANPDPLLALLANPDLTAENRKMIENYQAQMCQIREGWL